jgi:repressor of nif and glnA expression
MFEMRERIWIKEKTEMEERQKQNIENFQKIMADIRAKHEAEIFRIKNLQPKVMMDICQSDKNKLDRHSVSFFFLNLFWE